MEYEERKLSFLTFLNQIMETCKCKNFLQNASFARCVEESWRKMIKDCSICKYCDEDFIFDEETGEEYPFYKCQKGNDTSLDYECKDFERFMKNDCKYQ